jgi:hypothetical protein
VTQLKLEEDSKQTSAAHNWICYAVHAHINQSTFPDAW